MGKINRYLFRYSEFLASAFLLYFSIGLTISFTLSYMLVLIVLWIIKRIIFATSDEYVDTTFTSTAVFLTELAPIILSFTQVLDVLSTVILLFGSILMIFCLKFGSVISSDVAIAVTGLFSVLMILLNRGIDGALLLFTVMIIIITKYLYYTKLALPSFFVAVTIPIAILFHHGELGTIMILLLSLAIFITISGNKIMRIVLFSIMAAAFIFWLIIYKNNALYEKVLSISTAATYKRMIPRLFFRIEDDGQLYLLKEIVFHRSPANYFSTFTSPGYYTEIVKWESDYYTSSADYMFSVFTFFASPYSFMVFITVLYMLIESARRNIKKPQSIISVVCLARCIVHIYANTNTIPFTGVPFLFLSHGHSCAAISVAMILLLTILEQNSNISD